MTGSAAGNCPNMKLLNGKYGICRLDSSGSIPGWVHRGEFFSVTGTPDELSVVCSEACIPENVKGEKGWRILKVEGPLDFSLVGILASISAVLARNRISIFAVSTYDTDYILVRDGDIDNAVEALLKEGYKVEKEGK